MFCSYFWIPEQPTKASIPCDDKLFGAPLNWNYQGNALVSLQLKFKNFKNLQLEALICKKPSSILNIT